MQDLLALSLPVDIYHAVRCISLDAITEYAFDSCRNLFDTPDFVTTELDQEGSTAPMAAAAIPVGCETPTGSEMGLEGSQPHNSSPSLRGRLPWTLKSAIYSVDSKFIWCEDFAGVLHDGSLVRQTGLEKNSPASSRLNIRYVEVSISKAQRTPAPLLFRTPVHYLPRVCIFTGLPLVL
jgi:hypothetical protein